ncbi:branched-chain amino acid ABC transporter permease [Xanthobacter oligotrophicus]|uniref:branched-chain amino acid ABC transporter permease n=1 Tax=Xanthobacter oligotrophicus TaxID=2607286 RepID=UPI0011F1653D|nr:branched-chain amino acid ABC transporter permease [Xanthobacter oligotrophicus]MCG5237870.1 branched-chain amino acid ABC transporter permease [Xanthobacter oligotrophicus]
MNPRLLGGIAAGVAALAAVGLFADTYLLRLATTFAMYCALGLSWNLVGGYTGYPSFATAAFFGLGAYATAIAQTSGLPLPLAWATGGLVPFLFAGLLGLAILHLRGHYFAIASLVVADVLREVTNSWTSLTGGGMGLNLPLVGGSVAAQAQFYFWVMVGLALIALGITVAVDRSRLGVAVRCIAQNEDAAQIIGIDTRRAKVAAFALSGLLAGAAGGVYASWVTYIDPSDVYDVSLSVKPILMALLGGAGTVMGPVVGAFVFLASEELLWRNLLSFHAGLLGLLVVALVLFLPDGLKSIRWRGIIAPRAAPGTRS